MACKMWVGEWAGPHASERNRTGNVNVCGCCIGAKQLWLTEILQNTSNNKNNHHHNKLLTQSASFFILFYFFGFLLRGWAVNTACEYPVCQYMSLCTVLIRDSFSKLSHNFTTESLKVLAFYANVFPEPFSSFLVLVEIEEGANPPLLGAGRNKCGPLVPGT